MLYDIVLSNGKIVDGCENPWYWGDIGIRGRKITTVAPAKTLKCKKIIDVDGRFVSPGFIDIHTHSDLSILVDRTAESAIRQGCTTHVIGNCGSSPAPIVETHLVELQRHFGSISNHPNVKWNWRTFKDYLQVIEEGHTSINIASLIGHGALRTAAMGSGKGTANSTVVDKMRELLVEALNAGAFGLSTGLVYPPGCFSSTDEIIKLCEVVSKYHGFYASHIRGERETILEAVKEAIFIGQQANVPVQISHNAPKYGAQYNTTANLHLIEEARERGQDVTTDNDMHTDFGAPLTAALPQYIQELPEEEICDLLTDIEKRNNIRQEIIDDQLPAFGPVGVVKHGQWHRVIIFDSPGNQKIVGKSIADISLERNLAPFETFFDLIIENGHQIQARYDYIEEPNIRMLLQHPSSMICSDGKVAFPLGEKSNYERYYPCNYGEFPGVLERYVRQEKVLTLEQAVRKMTSSPAGRLGLYDRGIIRPGMFADITIFDLDRVRDLATGHFPHQYPEGIDLVFVNGDLVFKDGKHTGALPGKVLRRNS